MCHVLLAFKTALMENADVMLSTSIFTIGLVYIKVEKLLYFIIRLLTLSLKGQHRKSGGLSQEIIQARFKFRSAEC